MKRRAAGIVAGVAAALASAVVWWTHRSPNAGECTPDAFRAKVVAAAMSQVGKADLARYFADAAPQFVGQHPEWCGIFALWALHQAGLAKGVQWKTALGFLEVEHEGGPEGRDFPRTDSPKPGDVAYYAAPYQHHAVVAGVRSTSDGVRVDLINGNGAGGKVSLGSKPLEAATAYYSIQKYVDLAVAECAR